MKHSATTRCLWVAVAGWVLIGAGACTAHAAGINLSWDDCGTSGETNEQFACDTNTGAPFELIGSFDPPAGIQQFLGLSALLDVGILGPSSLPDWWALGAGQCRSGALSLSYDFAIRGPFTCTDIYFGQAAGNLTYEPAAGMPYRARIRLNGAVPYENRVPLDAGTEYYAFRLMIARAKTTGPGACAGCDDPGLRIILTEVQLFQDRSENNDPLIQIPIDRNDVTWQEGVVATKNSSWGQIRSQFR